MSREIEIKVPLSENQFAKIEQILLKKSAEFLQIHSVFRISKSDEYFSRHKTRDERIASGELPVIRIRTEKKSAVEPSGIDIHGDCDENAEKSYFCVKQKTIENGVEFNSEHETFVENPDALRVFFEASGYIKWFEKKKFALSCQCSLLPQKTGGDSTRTETADFEAHLELEKVNGLPYIEIEYTKDDVPPNTVRSGLEKILRSLGVAPENRDSRSWAEIIESQR